MTRGPARPRLVTGLGAAVAAALLLGACSGDEALESAPSTGASTGTATATAPSTAADPADTADPADLATGGEPGVGTAGGPSAAPSPRPTPTVQQTPVAPPGGEGDLEPVPTVAVTTRPPVAIDRPVQVQPGLRVRITDVEAVEVTGRGPGQVSGPAVAVTVQVVNDAAADLDVAGLAVSLAYADTEAGPVDGPPADPVVGPVPAASEVEGTYVFLVPEDQRRAVTIRVGLPSQPVVIFTGRATT